MVVALPANQMKSVFQKISIVWVIPLGILMFVFNAKHILIVLGLQSHNVLIINALLANQILIVTTYSSILYVTYKDLQEILVFNAKKMMIVDLRRPQFAIKIIHALGVQKIVIVLNFNNIQNVI